MSSYLCACVRALMCKRACVRGGGRTRACRVGSRLRPRARTICRCSKVIASQPYRRPIADAITVVMPGVATQQRSDLIASVSTFIASQCNFASQQRSDDPPLQQRSDDTPSASTCNKVNLIAHESPRPFEITFTSLHMQCVLAHRALVIGVKAFRSLGRDALWGGRRTACAGKPAKGPRHRPRPVFETALECRSKHVPAPLLNEE